MSDKKKKRVEVVSCEKCQEFEAIGIARVFPSFEALQEFPGYSGGDSIVGDPLTDVAVWPGKTNAEQGSNQSNWWFCAPAHPWCGHSYEYFDGDMESPQDSGFSDEDEENFDDFNKYLKKRTEQRKKIYKSFVGVWHENDCSCDPYQEDDWLATYINWRTA